MAKKNKNRGRGRARNLFGSAVTLAPALLAAATAFMNTSVARERGLIGDNGKNKKRTDDSDWFGDTSDTKKSRKGTKKS